MGDRAVPVLCPPPEALDLDVIVPVVGRQVTQAGGGCHVADREAMTVNAALGERPMALAGTWAAMLDVPSPDRCAHRQSRLPTTGESLMDRLDVRLASARALSEMPGPGMPDGRSALWAKLPDVLDMSAAALAVLGDYVPFGIGQALGLMAGGNSLDNTLRIGDPVSTEWVLLDVRVHHVGHGFGHGDVHLWSESGALLATASQSTIVRMCNVAPEPTEDRPGPGWPQRSPGVWGVWGVVTSLIGSMRILACRVLAAPRASNARVDAAEADRSGHQRGGVESALGEQVQRVAGSTGEYPRAKRRSTSLLIAIVGRMRSAPIQTPTTTTRDENGTELMIWSMIPGTPTHSNTTWPVGPRPSRSAIRRTPGQGSRSRCRRSIVPNSSSRPSGAVRSTPRCSTAA